MYNEFDHVCPVGLDRLFVAKKLQELTYLHLSLTFEKFLLSLTLSDQAIEKECLLTKAQKEVMAEIIELSTSLEKMQERDKIRLERYKSEKAVKLEEQKVLLKVS